MLYDGRHINDVEKLIRFVILRKNGKIKIINCQSINDNTFLIIKYYQDVEYINGDLVYLNEDFFSKIFNLYDLEVVKEEMNNPL